MLTLHYTATEGPQHREDMRTEVCMRKISCAFAKLTHTVVSIPNDEAKDRKQYCSHTMKLQAISKYSQMLHAVPDL